MKFLNPALVTGGLFMMGIANGAEIQGEIVSMGTNKITIKTESSELLEMEIGPTQREQLFSQGLMPGDFVETSYRLILETISRQNPGAQPSQREQPGRVAPPSPSGSPPVPGQIDDRAFYSA